jgi:hypothetical protein
VSDDNKPCWQGGNQHGSIVTREETMTDKDGNTHTVVHRQCQSCGRNL